MAHRKSTPGTSGSSLVPFKISECFQQEPLHEEQHGEPKYLKNFYLSPKRVGEFLPLDTDSSWKPTIGN